MDVADLVPARPLRRGRLLRQPLLHFLLLGALLQLLLPQLERWRAERSPRTPIVVQAEDLARLRDDWQRETGRPPSDGELRASLRHYVDQEILLREAWRLGLAAGDGVVRERLLRNLRFAFADEHGDEEELLQQAHALRMEEHDPVVRRRLMQLMEQRYRNGIALSEAEIRAYVAAHPERYARPPRYDLEQRFFSRDRRGSRAREDAVQARNSGAPGDPFLLGARLQQQTPADLTRQFGPGFAQALHGAPAGRWIGPLPSPYGWHLLRVERVLPAQPAAWAQVRQSAQYALLAEREQQALQQALKTLRAHYPLRLPAGVSL